MKRRRPRRTVGRCPECLVVWGPDAIEGLTPRDYTISVCEACGHLVVVWLSKDGAQLVAQQLDRAWFENVVTSDAAKKEVRELQEKQHRRNNHWG